MGSFMSENKEILTPLCMIVFTCPCPPVRQFPNLPQTLVWNTRYDQWTSDWNPTEVNENRIAGKTVSVLLQVKNLYEHASGSSPGRPGQAAFLWERVCNRRLMMSDCVDCNSWPATVSGKMTGVKWWAPQPRTILVKDSTLVFFHMCAWSEWRPISTPTHHTKLL